MSFSEWKEVKLGDVADILSGYAFKSKDFVQKGIPVIKIKNIVPPYVILDDTQFISDELAEEKKRYELQYNDVLISLTGSNINQFASAVGKIGRVKLKNQKLVLNQRVGKFEILDENKYNIDFLYYLISTDEMRYILASNAGGAANQANISPSLIKEIKLPCPPLFEQKAIADILSCIDDKIELNNRINKTLEEMAQAIFKNWFVDFEPFQDGEFEDSELGRIPKGWRVRKAQDFFDISIGKTPPRKEPQWFSTNIRDIKWVSISDMGKSGLFIFDTSEYLTKEAIKRHNIKLVPAGTVLLSFKLTVGRIAVTSQEMATNEAIAHFKTDKSDINEFLYCYLKNFNFNSLGNTSSIATAVNSKVVKAMPMMMPLELVLNDYHKIVTPLILEIRKNEEENHTLRNIRNTLLPRLMSGEIKVPYRGGVIYESDE